MRNVWIWFFSFLIWSCGWNQKIVLNTDDCDNTCYENTHYAIIDSIHGKQEGSFVLETKQATFKEIKIKYTLGELKRYKRGDNVYLIPIKATHNYLSISTQRIECLFSEQGGVTGYTFNIVESPEKTKAFTLEELAANDYVIAFQKLKRNARIIKKRKRKPIEIVRGERYYFKGGKWSNIRIGSGVTDCPRIMVKDIQKRLTEFGYNIEINNIMNQETKDALIDFQKKNNIEVGQLDFYTLEKLDLLFY